LVKRNSFRFKPNYYNTKSFIYQPILTTFQKFFEKFYKKQVFSSSIARGKIVGNCFSAKNREKKQRSLLF